MLNEKVKIEKGFQLAKEITKKNAKSFYFASLFLDKYRKKSAYSIYAICRISDDSVDNNYENRKKLLKIIEKQINFAYLKKPLNSPLLISFQKIIFQFAIPQKYFNELIEGMKMDLKKNNYKDFKELHNYCYKVAGVVGLIMLSLFKANKATTRESAIKLGIAMQLTNILRDIKEDYQKGRIYLPEIEQKRFNLDGCCFEKEINDNNFQDFMKFQIKRARNYYNQAEKGIRFIPSIRCRLTIYFMKNIYAAILDKIEKNNYNVFVKRAHTSYLEKILISLSTLFKLKYL
jgi:15-cis-phytoene synthase